MQKSLKDKFLPKSIITNPLHNIKNDILNANQTGLIDRFIDSNLALRPSLLINDYNKGSKVLSEIVNELRNCENFKMSVAFITSSGVVPLLETLKFINEKGVKGKILTTDYLQFSEPKALKKLLEFPNIEVKMYCKDNFHTKGYIFHHSDHYKVIVGSSNLTQSALTKNKEWNIKISSLEEGALTDSVLSEFDAMWEEADELTLERLEVYEKVYKQQREITRKSKVPKIEQYKLRPNKMQVLALQSLEKIHQKGIDKALLISATGTGKTYLSAFDIRNFSPKRALFIVHREQIAKQALESFKNVFDDIKSMGILSGNSKDTNKDLIFSTIQTLSKDEVLSSFSKDEFDYIVIDEVHKAGAYSYQKIANYFTPKFLLGMSATPERNDDFDIFKMFNYNIAYEIRLQDALEENLLCPFHYFGITDISIDGVNLGDNAEFKDLVCDQRVDHIIKQIKFYGYSGDRVRGLIFCSNNNEAKELSEKFNIKGFRTIALTGENTQPEREAAIEKLEQVNTENALDYIFTVDIFNEGVDIPSVNQIIMIRPTMSNIVFVQQLGRGLRKTYDKEYVIVIDFVGNYTKNFLIPIALSGDRTYNKDTIRKYVAEGNRMIPGCSTINFDEIARERIYESINSANFSNYKLLKDEYANLKNKLGHIPSLMDFYENGAIEPSIILNYAKSYYEFLKKTDKEYKLNLLDEQQKMLEIVSLNLANGKRPHELLMLQRLMKYESFTIEGIEEELKEKYDLKYEKQSVQSAVQLLNGEFWNSASDKKNYANCIFTTISDNGQIKRTNSYNSLIGSDEFRNQMNQLITYGLNKYEKNYKNYYKNTDLVLYQKYSRKDVCRLMNWDKDFSSVIYGYKVTHGMCPIFVTYKKSEIIDEGLKYDDKFINREVFNWMTRPNVKLDNKDVLQIKKAKETGLKIELFVNKSDDEGSEFYYMGRMNPIQFKETVTIHKGKEKPIVNIIYKMDTPVREDIYEYITK